MNSLHIDVRKIVIGLIFGSLNFVFTFVLVFVFFGLLKVPDNLSLSGITDTFIFPALITGLIGGFLSLVLLGYKSKLKAFLVGFLISFVAHVTFPILAQVFYTQSDFYEPLYLHNLMLAAPFILAVLLTMFFLPKEDFVPSQKPLVIVGILCLLTHAFMNNYFTSPATTIEVIPPTEEMLINEENESFEAYDERRIPKNDDEGIQFALANNFGIDPIKVREDPNKVRVEYKQRPEVYHNKFASGVVFNENFDQGESGQNFIAAKTQDHWVIIILGSGIIPLCKEIASYNIPVELLSACLDENGKLIERN